MTTKRSPARKKLTEHEFHAIARALSDRRRFAILEQVAGTEGMACSCLREQESISPATISHHIRELAEAGLIEVERQGRTAQLSLRRPVWEAYLRRLASL